MDGQLMNQKGGKRVYLRKIYRTDLRGRSIYVLVENPLALVKKEDLRGYQEMRKKVE
jgi:hypothetical protein